MAIPAIEEWPPTPRPANPPPRAAAAARAAASARAPAPPRGTWHAPRAAHPVLLPSALELVLDRIADGMIVIDTTARVLYANRPARELLGRVRDGAAASGALAFKDRPTQLAFERALAHCDMPHREDDGPPPHLFLVRDPHGATVARASVEPLQRCQAGGGRDGPRLVALHRRPDEAEACAAALRALHGLTAAEARIAAAAPLARSVEDLSRRVGLSRNTVKTHLKGVFRKCEVTCFGELVALVATGPRRR